MFRGKLIRDLKDEISSLERKNEKLFDDRYELQNKLINFQKDIKKRERQEILEDYDVAILIKNGNTYFLEKGKEEKKITSFTLRQYEGEAPVIEIEKALYGRYINE